MKRVCLSIVLLAAMVAAASAQEFRGAITGRITDEVGDPLPDVAVCAMVSTLSQITVSPGSLLTTIPVQADVPFQVTV